MEMLKNRFITSIKSMFMIYDINLQVIVKGADISLLITLTKCNFPFRSQSKSFEASYQSMNNCAIQIIKVLHCCYIYNSNKLQTVWNWVLSGKTNWEFSLKPMLSFHPTYSHSINISRSYKNHILQRTIHSSLEFACKVSSHYFDQFYVFWSKIKISLLTKIENFSKRHLNETL